MNIENLDFFKNKETHTIKSSTIEKVEKNKENIEDVQNTINKIRANLDLLMEDKQIEINKSEQKQVENIFEQKNSPEIIKCDNLSEIFLTKIEPDNAILSQIKERQLSKSEFLYSLETTYDNEKYSFLVHASPKSLWLEHMARNESLDTAKKDSIPFEFMSNNLKQMLLYCAKHHPDINIIQFAAIKGDTKFDSLTKPKFAKRQAEKRGVLFTRLLSGVLGDSKTSVIFEKDLLQRMPNAIIYDMYLKSDKKYKNYLNKLKNSFKSFLHI
ncbi:MAG: hypothetical protein WCI41_04170 [bacterium]